MVQWFSGSPSFISGSRPIRTPSLRAAITGRNRSISLVHLLSRLLSQLPFRCLHIWPHSGFHSYPTASALFISEFSIVAVLIIVSIRHLHLIPSIHLISSHLIFISINNQPSSLTFVHCQRLEHAISACISSTTPLSLPSQNLSF